MIENVRLHFYGISFKVKDAMIGVLKDMLYNQAVGLPCSLGRSGCVLYAWHRAVLGANLKRTTENSEKQTLSTRDALVNRSHFHVSMS